MFDRWFSQTLQARLQRPYVHLLFGARQTGKSTLLNALLPADTFHINLADPAERTRHLADPGEFERACRSLKPHETSQTVFVDESQFVPSIFDAVQYLYDADKTRWRFVLCGSSARKLRVSGANLLPGRSMLHHLYPLTLVEHPPVTEPTPHGSSPLPFSWQSRKDPARPFPKWDLSSRLAFGSLPGIVAADPQDRAEILKAYAFVHMEEEIRREALVKDWGAFARFLKLAAAESGSILNYAGISQESRISQPTVKSHYQLLEDMFVGFTVPAFSKSPRKNLLSTPKFFLFDLGIRHAAAGLEPSPEIVKASPGPLFEHWVGVELWKRLQYLGQGALYHQRSKDGAEVDFIIQRDNSLVPVEAKWTEHPKPSDARHLLAFMDEHPKEASLGYIICRCPRPLQIHDRVKALPWFCM